MSCFDNLRGLLPASMLDWPGKLCSVLFLGGCNFRCPYCHNPELVKPAGPGETLGWEDVEGYLRGRAGWIDGVSVTGGEPTLHDDLPRLCRKLRDLGMLVKLDTNGSRPRLLRRIIEEGLVDYVAMDVKTSLARYSRAAGIQVNPGDIEDAVDAVITSGLEHEFRCTVVPGLVEFEDLLAVAERLAGARVLVLNQFRSQCTLDPAYEGMPGYPGDLLQEWARELSRWVDTRIRGDSRVEAPAVTEAIS